MTTTTIIGGQLHISPTDAGVALKIAEPDGALTVLVLSRGEALALGRALQEAARQSPADRVLHSSPQEPLLSTQDQERLRQMPDRPRPSKEEQP